MRTSWIKKNAVIYFTLVWFFVLFFLIFFCAIFMLWSITFLWVHLLVAQVHFSHNMLIDCEFQHYDFNRCNNKHLIQINQIHERLLPCNSPLFFFSDLMTQKLLNNIVNSYFPIIEIAWMKYRLQTVAFDSCTSASSCLECSR